MEAARGVCVFIRFHEIHADYKTYSIEGKLREEGWDEELELMSEQDRLNLFTIAPVQRNLPDLNGKGAQYMCHKLSKHDY